jgi:pilus assembly protein Flp/PilA
MKSFLNKARRFFVDEAGPAAVEYAVLLALIAVVCMASVGRIGKRSNTTFKSVSKSLVVKSGS